MKRVKLSGKNSITTIVPYKRNGIWQFDDERTGLQGEAFVAGADDFIEKLGESVDGKRSHKGFNLLFSPTPFPGHQLELHRSEVADICGTTYIEPNSKQECWLCPALFLYFDKAPDRLYAQAKPLSAE